MKDTEELEEIYELKLDEVAGKIVKSKAKTVLLQFPDLFKPYAASIVDELEKRIESKMRKKNKETTKPVFMIWLGSCFGACDIPRVKNVDLIVQFGHSSLQPDY